MRAHIVRLEIVDKPEIFKKLRASEGGRPYYFNVICCL